MNKKLLAAMVVYAAIAVLAAFTLDGDKLRDAVWVLMAGLALKTFISHKARS